MQEQTHLAAHRINAAYHDREATHRALIEPSGTPPHDLYAAGLIYRFSTLAPNRPPYSETVDKEIALLGMEHIAYQLGLGVLTADFLVNLHGLTFIKNHRAQLFKSQAEEAMAELIEQGGFDDTRRGVQVQSALQHLGGLIDDLHAACAHLQRAALSLLAGGVLFATNQHANLSNQPPPDPVTA